MAGRSEYELLLSLKAALGNNFQSTFNSASNEVRQLQRAMQDSKGTMSELSRREAELKRAMKDSEAAAGTNTAEYRRLSAQLEETQRKKTQLRDATNNARQAQEELAQATQRLNENKQAITATKRELLFTMGKIAGAGVAAYMAFVRPAAAFESSMSDVQAQTGMTAEEIEELGGIVRTMGRTANQGGQEIADALAAISIRGQDVAHSAEIMRVAMVLADATGDSLKNTAYFIGNYLDKIGKDARYAESYLNIFAKTVQGTGIGLGTLQDYLFRANATLNMAGISGTEATAVFGQLYQAGVRGANAYSGFQQSVQSLMLPSDNAAAALRELGINVSALQSQGYGMMDIMFKVGDALDTVENGTDRLRIQQAIFTQQSALAFSDELFTQRETLRDLIPELYEAGEAARGAGVAYQIAATRTDNFNAQMQRARNAADDFRKSVGLALLPVLTQAAGVVTDVVTRVADFAYENPELVRTIFKVVGALAALKVAMLVGKLIFLQMKTPVLLLGKAFAAMKVTKWTGVIKGLTGATGKAGGKFGKFGKILKVLGKKLLPVVLIITVLAAVFGALGGEGENAAGPLAALQDIFASIRPILQMLMERLGELAKTLFPLLAHIGEKVIAVLGELLSAILPVLISLFESLLPVLKEVVMVVFAVFVDVLKALLPLIMDLISAILPVLLNLINTLLPIIKELVMVVFAVFIDVLKALLPVIMELIQAILPVLIQLIDALLPIITQLVTMVLPIFVSVLETLLPIITTLIQAILPVLKALLEALMPVIRVLADVFAGVLGAAISSVTDILSGVMRVLGGIIDFITGVFTGNWEKAWGGVRDIFSGIMETLGALIRAPINAVISIINGAIRGINSLSISIPNWVPIIGGNTFGINVPEIPMLAKGSNRSPDTFIAGEEGPELITGAKGRKVFTATETGDIFNKLKAFGLASKPDKKGAAASLAVGKKAMSAKPLSVDPPSLKVEVSSGKNYEIKLENKPVIHTSGDPKDLEAKLWGMCEMLVEMILEKLRQEDEDEWRGEFA